MAPGDTDRRQVVDQSVKRNRGCRSLGAVPGWQRRIRLRWVSAIGCASCFTIGAAHAAPLSEEEFAGLAMRCAPTVAVQTLRAVALTESGLDPWALHDNTTGVSERPPSFNAALTVALLWLDHGDSVDIGLMQINSANLAALGTTARTALDACVSLAGGAAVLQAAYGGGATPADQQVALLLALSRYNTGSPFRGIMNGYARRVMARSENASVATPILRPSLPFPDALPPNPNAPPAWNVGAVGSYAQKHGAPWLIALSPAPSPRASTLAPPAAPGPAIVVAVNAPPLAAATHAAIPQQKHENP